jgi:hypothetical protein
MPRKLFLLADDRAFRQLRAAGLSDELLVDGGKLDQRQASEPKNGYIERRDPADLIPRSVNDSDDEDSEPLDVEQRDQLFANLLGSVVCHLVVLENDPKTAKSDEVVLKNSALIKQLERWYNKFHEEVAQRVDFRQYEYRHVLILVCADEVPHKHLASLHGLLDGNGEGRSIDACYVMLRRLNWGAQHVCHSRYVWPISVARLLIYLMATQHDSLPHAQRTDATPVLAWRGIELVPDIPSSVIDEHFQRRLAKIHDRLFATTTKSRGATWNEDAFDPDPDLPKAELKQPHIESYGYWQAYDSQRALDEVESADRWEGPLRANGARFATTVGRALLADESQGAQQLSRVWRQLHGDPTILRSALDQRGIVRGPDVETGLGKMVDDFGSLAVMTQEREEAIQDARECSGLIEEAQLGFVERSVRAILTATVAIFVSYASIMIFGDLFSNWEAPETWITPLVVAGAGIFGALLAAIVPFLMERRAGERAVRTFSDDILVDIDKRMIRRDWACQQLMEDGHRFWAKSRAASAARRLRLLMRRLKAMVDGELHLADPVVEVRDDDGQDLASETVRQRRGRRQQQEFQEQTRIRQEINAFVIDDDALDQLTESRIEQFIQLWSGLCRDHDRQLAGNMPAQFWLPELRDFRELLRAAVTEHIYGQAIRQLVGDHDRTWMSGLQDFLNQDYSYYMSCPVTASDMDRRHRAIRLLLRTDLQEEEVGQELQDINVDFNKVMDTQPSFGLLFDEVPVKLGEGNDGYVRAIPYEA